MLSCAAAAALTRAQPELRCYREFQTREAAESARMLEMHYQSFEDQKEHQQMAVELAAALADGMGALLKFVYRASRELLRSSPAVHSLRCKALYNKASCGFRCFVSQGTSKRRASSSSREAL